jgi:hypothetical protein
VDVVMPDLYPREEDRFYDPDEMTSYYVVNRNEVFLTVIAVKECICKMCRRISVLLTGAKKYGFASFSDYSTKAAGRI